MEKQDKVFQAVCFVLGCCVLITGVVMFIIFNKDFFATKKVEGRIVTCIDITTSDGDKHQYVTAEYYVNNMVYETEWENIGISYREMDEVTLYYRSGRPDLAVSLNFEYISLFVILLGMLLIAMVVTLHKFDGIEGSGRYTKKQLKQMKKSLMLKKQIVESSFQVAIGIIFMTFGICVAIIDYHSWSWAFMLFGLAFSVFMGYDFYLNYNRLVGGADIKKEDIIVEDIQMEEVEISEKGKE